MHACPIGCLLGNSSCVRLLIRRTNRRREKRDRTANHSTGDVDDDDALNAMLLYRLVCALGLVSISGQCDIWKAAECPQGPSQDDEDLMKSHLYSEEQLLAYCDAGKTYADCVNEHLLCCDLRAEYAAALGSLDIQLRRNSMRLGKYCADFNETSPIQYRCRTTTKSVRGTRMRRTTTPPPVCDVEKVSDRQRQDDGHSLV